MKKWISYSKKNNSGAVEVCTYPHSSERRTPVSAPEEIPRIGAASLTGVGLIIPLPARPISCPASGQTGGLVERGVQKELLRRKFIPIHREGVLFSTVFKNVVALDTQALTRIAAI